MLYEGGWYRVGKLSEGVFQKESGPLSARGYIYTHKPGGVVASSYR